MSDGKPLIFTAAGKKYRFYGRWGYEWERGYVEPAQILDNVLEVWKGWWRGWKVLHVERVPTHVWISSGCGLGTGEWESPLHRKVEEIKNGSAKNG